MDNAVNGDRPMAGSAALACLNCRRLKVCTLLHISSFLRSPVIVLSHMFGISTDPRCVPADEMHWLREPSLRAMFQERQGMRRPTFPQRSSEGLLLIHNRVKKKAKCEWSERQTQSFRSENPGSSESITWKSVRPTGTIWLAI